MLQDKGQFRKEPQVKFAKLKAGLLASALTISTLGLGTASAQTNAYQTAFTTSITYQNVGSGTATINLDFYAENGATTVAAVPLAALAPNAATAIFVGNVNGLSAGFTGSGVLSSDQPLVATLVQIPAAASAVKNRPLSNGFSSGSAKVLIGTVLKNRFNTTSKFSIQNTDSGAIDLTVNFYAVGSTTPLHTATHPNLPANAAKYYDAGAIAQLGTVFDGSVTVDIKKAGTQTPGSAVGSVMELNTTGTAASAFEGVAAGANTVYMASAICNTFNANSSYAVQNTGTAATNITVTYAAPDGAPARRRSITSLLAARQASRAVASAALATRRGPPSTARPPSPLRSQSSRLVRSRAAA
jgi:hypothetical protein